MPYCSAISRALAAPPSARYRWSRCRSKPRSVTRFRHQTIPMTMKTSRKTMNQRKTTCRQPASMKILTISRRRSPA